MLVFTTILAYFSNLIAAIKTRKTVIITLFLIGIAFIIMSFVPSSIPDYAQYYSMYYFDYTQVEKGYEILSEFFLKRGVDYSSFRIVTTLIGITTLSIAIYRFTNDLSKFWMLYFLFPFFIDVIQVRNFLMMSFATLAASFLIKINFKNVLIYICLIIIGSSFQNAGLFFFIPLLFMLFRKKKIIKQLFVTFITLLSILSILSRSLVYSIIYKIMSIVGAESMISSKLTYYMNGSVNYGFLLYWLAILFSYAIVNYSLRAVLEHNNSQLIASKMAVIESFSLTSLLSLPLIIVSLDFFRIARDIFPLVIVAYVLMVQTMKQKRIPSLTYRCVFYANLILNIVIVYRVIWNTGIFPMLFENTLF